MYDCLQMNEQGSGSKEATGSPESPLDNEGS